MALLLHRMLLLRRSSKPGVSSGGLDSSGLEVWSLMTLVPGPATRSGRSSSDVPPAKREARIDGA
eukprot:4462613-Amphidinium_carterae.1